MIFVIKAAYSLLAGSNHYDGYIFAISLGLSSVLK